MSSAFLQDRRTFVGTAAVALAGAGLGIYAFGRPTRSASAAAPSDELSSLRRATGWLNTPPLTAAALSGKVVLIDVWTYTCINWLRTLPYVRAWHEKYRESGLTIIGVHAPEFGFEQDVENVRRSVMAMGITHPIAIDNTFEIWRAFGNRYWPSRYLLGPDGRIRHHHFGEGEYERSERMIQELLREAGARDVSAELVRVDGRGVEAAADWKNLKSPETYLGYERTVNFVSPHGSAQDERREYAVPERLRRDQWALSGEWTVRRQSTRLDGPSGLIRAAFHARDLHLVMGPSAPGAHVRFRVSLDGRAPGAAHGADIDAEGNGVLTDHRLYQLVRQPASIADRQFAVEFLDPGAEAFAFTFG